MDYLIDQYFELQDKVHDAFGYVEDWAVIPLADMRGMHWHYNGTENHGEVYWSDVPLTEGVYNAGNYYSATLYTQRFLPKWIYKTDTHTMICIDTHTDGNKFLAIFSNDLED